MDWIHVARIGVYWWSISAVLVSMSNITYTNKDVLHNHHT